MEVTWRPIEEFDGNEGDLFDLWFDVWASPRSMGMADAWRATNCWRKDGKWFDKDGELYALLPEPLKRCATQSSVMPTSKC